METLKFDIVGDNHNIIKALDGTRAGISSTVKEAEQAGIDMDDIFRKIAQSAAAIGVGFSATQLVKDVARVRGEFQQLEIAFSTMLGSEEEANALFQQLVNTAAKTPFDLQGVAGGAKQLLAYGIEADKVNETLVRLGDIAAGLSIPLGDLVYLYGTTMTQGRLFTQDLRQFQGRGIPLADELAKQFGVTKDAVGALVTEGKVGFENLEKAIVSMTSEGGKFGGLMAKQSASITGQLSNLEDAWDSMLNEMGKKTQDSISGAISITTNLVENYEEVLDILGQLIVTYGAYKAVMMATSAFNSAATKASYAIEMAELEKLIPLKEKSANADVESALASGQISEASAQKVIAMRAEAQAHVEKLEAIRKAEASNAARAFEALRENEEQIDSLKERIAQLRELGKSKEADAETTKLQSLMNARQSLAEAAETAQEIANTAATNANTAATALNTTTTNTNTIATNLLTAAKLKLAAISKTLVATLNNPYVLAASAVAALSFGIYKLITAKSAEEKAIEMVNKEREEANAKREEEKNEIDSLLGVISDETKTRTEQIRAYNRLKGLLPELTEEKSLDELQTMSNTEIQKAYNAEIEKTQYNDAVANAEAYREKLAELARQEEEVKNRYVVTQAQMAQQGTALRVIDTERALYKERLKQAEDFIKEQDELRKEAQPIEVKIKVAEDIQAQAQAAYDEAYAVYEEEMFKKAQELQELNVDFETINWDNVLPQYVIDWLRSTEAALAGANAELKSLKEQEKKATTNKTLTDKERSEYEKRKREQQRRAEELVKLKKETNEDLAELEDDELKKELASITSNYEKRLQEIDKLEKEWRDAQRGKLTKDQTQALEAARNAAKLKQDKELAEARKENERRINEELLAMRESANDDLFELEEDEHIRKMAQIQNDYDERIREIKEQERKWRDAQGGNLTQDQVTAITQATDAAEKKRDYQEKKANKENLESMLSDVMTYEQKRTKVSEEYSKKRALIQAEIDKGTEGFTQANLDNLNEQEQEVLQGIDDEFASKSETFLAWTNSIAEMSIKQLLNALNSAKNKLRELESSGTSNEDQLAQARATIKRLEDQIKKVDAEASVNTRTIDKWKDLKEVLDDVSSEFEEVGEAIGGTVGASISAIGSLATDTVGLINNIFEVVDVCSKGIIATSTGAVSAIKAVEAASVILALISAAITLYKKVVDVARFFRNDKYEEQIEANQEKIENLDKSYEHLSDTLDEVFGSTKVKALKEMNDNLEKQNDIIRDNIKQTKKEWMDDDEREQKLKSYQDELDANNKLIAENQEAMEEAIFGSSIQSAIEDFASAYADAVKGNMDLNETAEEQAKQAMKDMVQESIKEYIAGTAKMEEIRAKMKDLYADGAFDKADQKIITDLYRELNNEIDDRFAWAEELLGDEESAQSTSSTGKGIATASQESVDENNGRLMSIQLSMADITSHMVGIVTNLSSITSVSADNNSILSDIRMLHVQTNGWLQDIAKYTKPLNDSINSIVEQLKRQA